MGMWNWLKESFGSESTEKTRPSPDSDDPVELVRDLLETRGGPMDLGLPKRPRTERTSSEADEEKVGAARPSRPGPVKAPASEYEVLKQKLAAVDQRLEDHWDDDSFRSDYSLTGGVDVMRLIQQREAIVQHLAMDFGVSAETAEAEIAEEAAINTLPSDHAPESSADGEGDGEADVPSDEETAASGEDGESPLGSEDPIDFSSFLEDGSDGLTSSDVYGSLDVADFGSWEV